MTTYKFRAECATDAVVFFKALEEAEFDNIHFEPAQDEALPDVEVVFDSDQSLARLIQVAKTCEDCHVIAQTIRPIDRYTGERNYLI